MSDHERDETYDLPEIITPLDRIHPLPGRPHVVRETGTVTGRVPRPDATEASEDVHFDQDTALELLNDAADMIRRAINTDVADLRTLNGEVVRWTADAEIWLARFEELGR